MSSKLTVSLKSVFFFLFSIFAKSLAVSRGEWALAANPFATTQFVRTPPTKLKQFAARPLAAKPLVATF